MRILFVLPAIALSLAVTLAHAQTAALAPRSDGAQVPLMVYGEAKTAGGACAPVIIFSPGLGGTERGYAYFGKGMAAAGYRVLIMGHKESGPAFLMSKIRSDGLRPGLLSGVEDKPAEAARLLDVDATVRFADQACRADILVLAGHSMGGITSMLEAGAQNVLGIAPSSTASRFAAFVALSPEGAGPVFAANGWSKIQKPVLMMTGTRDQGTGGDYRWRMTAYDSLPKAAGAHWLGVVDGGTHMDFARNAEAGAGPRVIAATTAFLANVRGGQWNAPPPAQPNVMWQTK